MYYVDYLAMIASYLKPSLNSSNGARKLRNYKRISEQDKNQIIIKPILASICFLFCIILVPEKPSNLTSICEKYNSSAACQVW
ncbi:hypothetical protein EW15_0031 [Prochlorococcus sp. MIT 0801]|nr:hypothetical protein EW15_0031 [Prochlorococcus sp. MIT 0801]